MLTLLLVVASLVALGSAGGGPAGQQQEWRPLSARSLAKTWTDPRDLVLTAPVDPNSSRPYAYMFSLYRAIFGKAYASPQEERMRYAAFEENVKFLLDFRARNQSLRDYRVHLQEHSDRFLHEFGSPRGQGLRRDLSSPHQHGFPTTGAWIRMTHNVVPREVNWASLGHVSPLRSNGKTECGSSWAFAVTDLLESLLSIHEGRNVLLSAQQLLDCGHATGNRGCAGGHPSLGLEYVQEAGGLALDREYPLRAGACHRGLVENATATVLSKLPLPRGVASLKKALQTGPVVVEVHGSTAEFIHYDGGVFGHDCSSDPADATLAALLVGYEDGYWILKNSWGPKWGEDGFMRLAMGNPCGIANTGLTAMVESLFP